MKSDWYKQAFYRVSVKALIRNDNNQILMVNEKSGDFSLPGGGWDYSESLHDCLARELREEIALKTDFNEQVITAIPFYNPSKKAQQMWIACTIHYSELEYGVGEDADEVCWIAESDIDDSTLAGKLIKQVLSDLHS